MSRVTLLESALRAAHAALTVAETDCPHWDWDGPCAVQACCDALADAQRRVDRLSRALRRARMVDAARAGDADAYYILTRA